MGEFRIEKVVSNLPNPLEPDTIYFVRTGAGFDLYATDATGTIAYTQNSSGGGGGGTTVKFFQVEDDGTTGQLTTGSAVSLTGIWGTPSLTSSDFSFSAGVLTVNTAGVVEFDVKTTGYQASNNRQELHVQVYKNGSQVIIEDAQYASRNNSQREGSAYICGFKDTAAIGDTYEVRVYDVGVASTIGASQVAGQTYFSVKLYV